MSLESQPDTSRSFRAVSRHVQRDGGGQHRWAALACVAIAAWIAYVVWSRQPGLRVPPSVGYLAAGSFALAGVSLFFRALGFTRAAAVPAVLATAALAGIGAWIGFGPGGRRCEGSIGGLGFLPAEWACRFAFGAGSVLTTLVVLLMIRAVWKGPDPT